MDLRPQVVDFHGECPASRNRGTHGVLAVEGLELGGPGGALGGPWGALEI